ncbi:50S ribosomal protein L24 [Halodesulfurarchaeum sp. HSR-GB]|uniref:50S ribosomal protein L24 n=1 Tax=Halodesulfurarchaeum sp. HSR-GB TaxID=3074077 RepID=UPI002866DC0F|nr:50S ribosomal protein L24 [Halodesulfurarchaeum sp. HSR-GB]MDR5655836.1 50S ribosomal protein L24 [Halodesulfurarchaeum sp. HSR-GB]
MSEQPTKQRMGTERAPLHERHKQVRATLSDDLREEYGQRSVTVNAGDTVEVLRGDFAGEEGEVLAVDLKAATVHVEGVTQETAEDEEVPRPLDASNLRVTELDLEDPVREARLEGETE